MRDFIFDINDYQTIPGLQRPWDGERPFLVPVFFEKNVLTRYLYDPNYKCEFHSETYGTIFSDDGDCISFGINPNGLIIMWLGDIDGLAEKEKLYFLSHNVPPDHDIRSEFFDAQINVVFTEPIKEVEIFIQKRKLNSVFQNKFGFNLFLTSYADVDELFSLCSKYKKILIGGEDDFKKFISEWNETLIEDLNTEELRKDLNDKNIGDIKLLEKFIKEKLGEKESIILPYFVLYDLRIWADHKGCQEKFDFSIQRLEIDTQDIRNYQLVYQRLITKIIQFHDELLKRAEEYAKT